VTYRRRKRKGQSGSGDFVVADGLLKKPFIKIIIKYSTTTTTTTNTTILLLLFYYSI
jgi:hypothetical protein